MQIAGQARGDRGRPRDGGTKRVTLGRQQLRWAGGPDALCPMHERSGGWPPAASLSRRAGLGSRCASAREMAASTCAEPMGRIELV